MEWICEQPKLARMVGRALFSVGGFIIVSGLIGRVAMTAINSTRGLGNLPALNGLSEAYPMYSLWWVPEHFIGYAVGGVLAVAGLYVALTAKAAFKAIKAAKGRYA